MPRVLLWKQNMMFWGFVKENLLDKLKVMMISILFLLSRVCWAPNKEGTCQANGRHSPASSPEFTAGLQFSLSLNCCILLVWLNHQSLTLGINPSKGKLQLRIKLPLRPQVQGSNEVYCNEECGIVSFSFFLCKPHHPKVSETLVGN